MNQIYITECPRDGQQGLPFIIPPQNRAAYINQLMEVGYDIIDFGSFVSPKAVPQMADSNKVLDLINKKNSNTKLLAIVGNLRGAQEAAGHEKIDILGFPYSVSDTFLRKNINSSIDVVFQNTLELKKVCDAGKKSFRVYISMAFGNPYGDAWNEQLLDDTVKKLVDSGINIITLSDTIGLATPDIIRSIFEKLLPKYTGVELGIHLHTKPADAYSKIDAAWKAGCRNYDSVLNGFGGCPMTGYELLGNLNTLELIGYSQNKKIMMGLDAERATQIANRYPNFDELKIKATPQD